MAAYQPARRDAETESVADFMARRRREVELRDQDADNIGREAWAASTRTGQNMTAARPSDVLVLGAHTLERRAAASSPTGRLTTMTSAASRATPTGPRTEHPDAGGMISYGALHAHGPSPEELADLRRQQAEFGKVTRDIDVKNSWLAVPALAPAAVIMGIEGAVAIAGGIAGETLKRAPFQFVKRDPHLRVGDNWATRAGRRAHAALKERVAQKPGWDPEPHVKLPDGRIVKPDVRTPPRVRKAGKNPKPFQMELKPNTPSGRRAAERAVKKYEPTSVKTRPIYYDPKPFI